MSFKEGNEKGPVLVGPWGGQGGVPWDDGVYSTVRQIVITHGTAIDSIRIEYDRKGTSLWSVKHGGNGGAKTDKVCTFSNALFQACINLVLAKLQILI